MKAFFRFLKLFFAGDPYPETPATIARAKAANAADRIEWDVDDDGKRRRLHGLSEIHKAKADNLAYFAEHRPKGYAFTFDKEGK